MLNHITQLWCLLSSIINMLFGKCFPAVNISNSLQLLQCVLFIFLYIRQQLHFLVYQIISSQIEVS